MRSPLLGGGDDDIEPPSAQARSGATSGRISKRLHSPVLDGTGEYYYNRRVLLQRSGLRTGSRSVRRKRPYYSALTLDGSQAKAATAQASSASRSASG
jgi:hypothetical protein